MGEHLIKPYELSIWEDRLIINEDNTKYFKEFKIAVLGSDKMTSPQRAMNPVLTENVNGEKTLAFSLASKYFNPLTGEIEKNPLEKYLVNERKIKLLYGDKWYEFVIKTKVESSEEYIYNYTARELFVLELSKVGYDVVLDQSLNNNQGTITELASKVLEGTDWKLDTQNSDLLQQLVQDPIYDGTIVAADGLSVINLDTNEIKTLPVNQKIYLFYSYVANKTSKYVQFMCVSPTGKEVVDDNCVITSTNYRINTEVVYKETENGIDIIGIESDSELDEGPILIHLTNINYQYQGYRLVYAPLTTYDPVMNRTVDIYEANYDDQKQTIYHYTDYNYATSQIVASFLTNSNNFNIYENGEIQGWSARTELSRTEGDTPVIQPLTFVTDPPVNNSTDLRSTNMLSSVEGFLQMKFHDVLGPNYENTYFNSGFEDAASMVDHITAGEEFVLRARFKTGGKTVENLQPGAGGIRAIVAQYTEEKDEKGLYPYYLSEEAKTANPPLKPSYITVRKINPGGIILNFDGDFELSENIICNGSFSADFTKYIVDDVVQTPSTLYCYRDKKETEATSENTYIWSNDKNQYVVKDSSYADYYLTTTKAHISYTNKVIADPLTKIGVFLYVDDPNLVGDNKYIYLQDIQLTRCYRDNGEIILQGNVPTATSIVKDQFYVKPLKNITANEINLYESLDDLARVLGVERDSIKQTYNENSEKILSIQASRSNIFDILQSLCETFECWLSINVEHEPNGAIKLDKNKNPIKKIAFKQYAGKDNFAGFRYGINLESIERTFESEELVTKLIVEPVQSEFTSAGAVDIQHARSNPSGQSYILNFSYFQNQQLIDTEEVNKDISNLNIKLKQINDEIHSQSVDKATLANAISRVQSKYRVIDNLVHKAIDDYEEAVVDFAEATGMTYEVFVSHYNNLEDYIADKSKEEEDKATSLASNDTIIEIIGKIYTYASAINNYTGILTNLEEEYNNLALEYNGAKEYGISVGVNPNYVQEGMPVITTIVVDDYLRGLSFKLYNNDETLEYDTNINTRIFEINSGIPYNYFVVTRIPEHYRLEIFKNNCSYYIERDNLENAIFTIYSAEDSKTITRRFKLVPDEDWLQKHPGYEGREVQLIEEKRQLEKEFYTKYSRYIQEGIWTSQDYVDPELYYLDALQVSNTSAQPKASYTIQVAEISEIPERNNYYFEVGDKTYIEDVEFFGYQPEIIQSLSDGTQLIIKTPIQEEVIVSEVEWHLDAPDENVVTIQNYKTRFEDLFQRISAAVQTVQYNEATYAKTSAILDDNGNIKSELLSESMMNAASNGFVLTSDGTIRTDGKSLIVQDLTNNGNYVRIISGGIQISSDGGKTWGTALDANGISTNVLTAGTINTQNIWLMDGDNPSFRWDKAGLNAYGLDENGNQAYDLKTYVRFDKYGLYGVKNGEDFVASSLDNVRDTAFFGITWDGFFIKNSYTDNGEVSITSEDDFVVKQNNIDRIKIGAIVKPTNDEPGKYGIRIKNADGESVFETGDDGNITVTGTINATNGLFSGTVAVGNNDENHVVIDGNEATIKSSNYSGTGGLGWAINGEGDAYFSNVSVRGAIKTAVFEYEDIQAVGGAFLFRPSSSIKSARYVPTEVTEIEDGVEVTRDTYYHYENGEVVYNDLYLIVEKPLVFRVGSWCKISNYASEKAPVPTIDSAFLGSAGLTHVYEITAIDVNPHPEIYPDDEEETPDYTNEICLEGGAAILEVTTLEDLAGGSLLDFGSHAQKEGIDVPGEHNYGIGINSSDNYVSLPPRAISLFETTIHPEETTKVTYNMRGILGTLPAESAMTGKVDSKIYRNMAGTQGIYTDNMYIGDLNQYLAFYTDKQGNKQLKIRANQIMFEVSDPQPGEDSYKDIAEIEAEGVPGPPGPAGQDGQDGEPAITVQIDSSAGTVFLNKQITTTLTCTVIQGNGTDITNQVSKFTWVKKNADGTIDTSWSRPLAGNMITLSEADVTSKAIFTCEVEF